MKNLQIQGLDFDSIKSNFISFLKNIGTPYNSWNFSGSNITALMNMFAYATHYIGYYAKMVLQESFIDSATQKSSLYSKAKLVGYLPTGMRSSRAVVKLNITTTSLLEPLTKSIIIPKYSYFTGNNISSDTRNFYVIDNIVCLDRDINNNIITYTSPEFLVYEGKLKQWLFQIDTSILNQKFIIRDYNLDIDTLRINVYDDTHPDTKEEYFLTTSFIGIIDSNSKVFYLTTNEEGYYEIYFGNNIFGKMPENNAIIECNYISTNGNTGDGCTKMVYQKPATSEITRQTTGSYDDFNTIIVETSQGGNLSEDLESLRFNIPNHFKRQNRICTKDDYKTFLLDKFSVLIDSINVWGGEDNDIKTYNSVFVSIKPKNGLYLSSAIKSEIKLLLQKYNVSNLPIIFKDPDYTKINLNMYIKYDYNKTNISKSEIQTNVYALILEYNQLYLDRFNTGLSDLDLLNYIKTNINNNYSGYIISLYDTKQLEKQILITYLTTTEYSINFGNILKKNTMYSSNFTYAGNVCYLKDNNGNIFIHNKLDDSLILPNKIGTIDYDKGIIKFILNLDIITDMDNSNNTGYLKLYSDIELSDVNTYLNNILLFENINVIATHQ